MGNSCFVEDFKLLFRESGLAPLFHPLSFRKTTLSGCSERVPASLIGQNLPPEPLEMVVQFFLLGHPYGSMAQQLCDLFRVRKCLIAHSVCANFGLNAHICVFVYLYLCIWPSKTLLR